MNLDLTKIQTLTDAAGTPPVVATAPPEPPTVKVETVAHGTVASGKGTQSFVVQLEGEPPLRVDECIDRLDAQEKYNKTLGIISTTRKYTYTDVTGQ